MKNILVNGMLVGAGAGVGVVLGYLGLPWWLSIIVTVLGISAWENMQEKEAEKEALVHRQAMVDRIMEEERQRKEKEETEAEEHRRREEEQAQQARKMRRLKRQLREKTGESRCG
jgi:septin family protein